MADENTQPGTSSEGTHFPGGPPPGFPADMGSPARMAASQATLIYAVCIAPLVVSCLSVLLRMYARTKILRSLGLDDYTIVAAQVFSFIVTVLTCLHVTLGGLGRHIEFVKNEEMAVGLKLFYANTILYNFAQISIKTSFLLQFRRLFPDKIIRHICTYGIYFLLVWGFAQTFWTSFSCTPLEMIIPAWKGRCINTFIVLNLNSIFNVISDFIIFVIPIYPVWHLQMARRRKFHLLLVFSLGFFCCAVSTVRLAQLYEVGTNPDMTWYISGTMYWSAIELNIGILAASLPTLRPLVKAIAPILVGSTQRSNKSSGFSHSMSTFKKSSNGEEAGIYVQKDVEFASTADLASKDQSKDPFEVRPESMDEIIGNDTKVSTRPRV